MITLEPDQVASVNGLIKEMQRGVKSVLLQGATGSGKSYIASDLLHRAVRKGKRTWFIVPRRDLVKQMAETFRDFGIEHSYIASGFTHIRHVQNHICSLDTLKLRLTSVTAPDVAIIDETHYGSEGLDKVIQWLKAAGTWIIGLSGTPWKMSGKGLGCWYDSMVLGPSIKWLIENKRLSQYKMFAPDHLDLSRLKVIGGDYAKGQLSELMEQDRVLVGSAVNHYKKHAMGKLGVTFAVSRKHSQIMAESYRNKGVPAMHVDGETPMDERAKIFKAYAKRELLQLTCAELLVFGFDISSASGVKGVTVQTMTDCQPTKSLAKQMQKYGRNLRYDGTTHLFFDHANNVDEHGLPNEDREWTLADREKKIGDESGRAVAIKQCSVCWYCESPKPVCSNCGHVHEINSREVEEIDGELQEIKEAQEKKEKRMEVGMIKSGSRIHAEAEKLGLGKTWIDEQKQISRDALKKIATERNYLKGWIYNQMKLRGLLT